MTPATAPQPVYADPIWNARARLHGGSPSGTSELAAANRCLQLHGFRYDLGLRPSHRPLATDNRERGVLVHIAFAHRYAARIPNFSRFLVQDPYDAMRQAALELSLGYLLDRSYSAYKVYDDFHGDNDPFQPVDVETPCEMTVTDQFGTIHRVTTLLDLVAWHRPTQLLVDNNHKTSASLRYAKPAKTSSTNLQFLCELALARTKYPGVAAVMVNPCHVPDSGTPQAAAPEFVKLSGVAYARLATDVGEVKRHIDEARRNFPNPLSRPRSYACQSPGLCEYHAICSRGYDALVDYTSTKYDMKSIVEAGRALEVTA